MSALAHLSMLKRNRLASKVWEVSVLKGDHTLCCLKYGFRLLKQCEWG